MLDVLSTAKGIRETQALIHGLLVSVEGVRKSGCDAMVGTAKQILGAAGLPMRMRASRDAAPPGIVGTFRDVAALPLSSAHRMASHVELCDLTNICKAVTIVS